MENETKTATRSPFSPERAKDKPPRPPFSAEWETDGFYLSLFLVEKEKNKLSQHREILKITTSIQPVYRDYQKENESNHNPQGMARSNAARAVRRRIYRLFE